MKHFKELYILGLLLVSLFLSGQENVLISSVLREPVQNLSEVNDANSIVTIEYYDTASRLVQTVQKGFGPNGEDLADYTQFDKVGRIEKEYLPTPFSGNEGAFIPSSRFEQNSQTWLRTYQYEASTEGRVLETSGMHVGGKNIKYDYRLSNPSEPELSALDFRMENNTTISKRTAVRGAYQVTEETDEDGHRTLLFTDSDEHIVLKRRIDGEIYHDTYMVYDIYNNLHCVLPPAAVDAYSSFDDQTLSTGNFLDMYAYFYIYDSSNQRISAKYPGADWIYTVYDGDYRPVLLQDGSQRKRNEWSFIKYDGLGRAIIEGVVYDRRSYDDLATIYKDKLVREEFVGTDGFCRGYTDHIKMGQGSYTLTCVRYYDNYAFTCLSSEWTFTNAESSVSAKGLLTGVFEAVLNQPEKGRYTLNKYNDKSRLIHCASKETLSNNTLFSDYRYNFSGALTFCESYYSDRCFLRSEYVYDHVGREKSGVCTLGYGTIYHTAPIHTLHYDSYGRLSEKLLQGNKVSMTYNYHNEGTLYNIISSCSFSETLYFGNSMLPYQLSRYCNGNIGDISISQNGALYFYHFDYDGFDRLTSGMMYGVNGNRMKNDEFFEYDKMGNITSLLRLEEPGSVNDLDIHYNGNQLLKVTDRDHGFSGNYDFAIYPDLADREQEYHYDGNGNETANLDKNIVAVRYNILNLPDTVQFGDGNRIVNYYLSNGIKLGSTSRTYTTPLSVPLDKITNSTDPFVETREWRNGAMHYNGDIAERIDIKDGYLQLCVNKTSGNLDSLKSYAYVCDHLGSVRQVCDAATGNVVQSLEYYPSGLIFRSTNYDLQPDKYTGKELISMHGLNQYYSKARMQEFQIPHFTTRDPLCEKYYDLSPYGYCLGNPIRFVDPDGKDNFDVLIGYGIGLITNVIPGSGSLRDSYEPNDPSDYNNALQGVDNASILVGNGMIKTGGTGMAIGVGAVAVGTTATVGSGGTLAIGGVPVAGAGVVLLKAGATTATTGAVLMANGKQNQDAGYNRGKNSGAKSINQLQKDVKKNQAPNGIKRFDAGKGYKEQDHVHFEDNKNSALNKDGTWKHGNYELNKKQKKYLKENGWEIED